MGLLDGSFGGGGASSPAAAPTSVAPPTFGTGMMGAPRTGYDVAASGLGALGRSLLTSPGNAPLQNLGTEVQRANTANAANDKQALIRALKAAGLSDLDAMTLATNPQAAMALLGGQSSGSFASPGTSMAGSGSSDTFGSMGAPTLPPLGNSF